MVISLAALKGRKAIVQLMLDFCQKLQPLSIDSAALFLRQGRRRVDFIVRCQKISPGLYACGRCRPQRRYRQHYDNTDKSGGANDDLQLFLEGKSDPLERRELHGKLS